MNEANFAGEASADALHHDGMEKNSGAQSYGASSIQVLKGLEAVRKRPGMYIGSTSIEGLHHLVYEVVDNSIDEAMAGYCSHIQVTLATDEMGRQSCTVEDDGRGIPVAMHPTEKRSSLEIAMTQLHAGGKFDKNSYKVSGGLHGVGVSCVNALSVFMEVTVCRDGGIYRQTYSKGVPTSEVERIGDTESSGTKVVFSPDYTILEEHAFNYDVLQSRFRELSFLNKGVAITITDTRGDEVRSQRFQSEGGISHFVSYLNEFKRTLIDPPIAIEGERDAIKVEIALQYNDKYDEK
ncbi:MAG TPA: ATP-binding protein, partial [Sphaerochaeta sp.]|nr:ATP-binding protein [Sphaerochaeta sp.]